MHKIDIGLMTNGLIYVKKDPGGIAEVSGSLTLPFLA